MEYKTDKSKLKDTMGRYLTQSLFLEIDYTPETALFTLDSEDKMYKGKKYISLKKLYIDMGDVEEYIFATTYLYDWPHWQKMCKSGVLIGHINSWREELHLKLASEGILTLINLAVDKDSYQAAKYLADKGFIKNKRGRPSKEEIEGIIKKQTEDKDSHDPDFQLLQLHKDKA